MAKIKETRMKIFKTIQIPEDEIKKIPVSKMFKNFPLIKKTLFGKYMGKNGIAFWVKQSKDRFTDEELRQVNSWWQQLIISMLKVQFVKAPRIKKPLKATDKRRKLEIKN